MENYNIWLINCCDEEECRLMVVANGMLGRMFGLERKEQQDADFEALAPVVMKCSLFWDTTPCSPVHVSWRFGGTCRQAVNRHEEGTRLMSSAWCLLHGGLLLDSPFII
jgi:hypothetical protein